MKESQISEVLRESMNAVRLSPALRARTLCAMRGSEERRPKMKRKFSAALAFALVGVLVVAVALAVANHAGLLDYMNASSNAQIPYDAASYIKQSAQSGEGNTFSRECARRVLRRAHASADDGYHGESAENAAVRAGFPPRGQLAGFDYAHL